MARLDGWTPEGGGAARRACSAGSSPTSCCARLLHGRGRARTRARAAGRRGAPLPARARRPRHLRLPARADPEPPTSRCSKAPAGGSTAHRGDADRAHSPTRRGAAGAARASLRTRRGGSARAIDSYGAKAGGAASARPTRRRSAPEARRSSCSPRSPGAERDRGSSTSSSTLALGRWDATAPGSPKGEAAQQGPRISAVALGEMRERIELGASDFLAVLVGRSAQTEVPARVARWLAIAEVMGPSLAFGVHGELGADVTSSAIRLLSSSTLFRRAGTTKDRAQWARVTERPTTRSLRVRHFPRGSWADSAIPERRSNKSARRSRRSTARRPLGTADALSLATIVTSCRPIRLEQRSGRRAAGVAIEPASPFWLGAGRMLGRRRALRAGETRRWGPG